jgi:hypothetical protein
VKKSGTCNDEFAVISRTRRNGCGSCRLFGEGHAPAFFGHQFVLESGAGDAVAFSGYGGEQAAFANLVVLVLGVFGCVHLGGVFLVTESHGGGVVFLEDFLFGGILTENVRGEREGRAEGNCELAEEMTACVHVLFDGVDCVFGVLCLMRKNDG